MEENELYENLLLLDKKMKELNKTFGLMYESFYLEKSYPEKVLSKVNERLEYKAKISSFAYNFRFKHYSITVNIKNKR